MEPLKPSPAGGQTATPPATNEFKTMVIPTKPQPTHHSTPFYPQTSYYGNVYAPIVSVIISFLQNESNKKFYKNEVLNIKMSQLVEYADLAKIKSFFPRCSTVNNSSLNFKSLSKAEFFILRSTCDDDIHKVP